MLLDQEEKEIELARRFGLSIYNDLSEFTFVKDRVAKIPYAFAKQHGV